MDDLIRRQDAIDAINEYGSVWMEYTDSITIDEIAERALKASKQSMVKILHDLPSAQPEVIACGEGELKSVDTVEVVRCKDCKWYVATKRKCKLDEILIAENDYCSYGERREDGI